MEELQNRLSSFSEWSPVRNGQHTPPQQQWAPLIDVIETADEYVIRADLPGVHKKDLGVMLEDGELTIKGLREPEPLAEGAGYVFNERPYGMFTRTFVLPSWAEASGIEAEFKHGVLTVKVRKAEQARARAITIHGD
jgi:HSP20 family protein